jgi:hemerythrin
MLEWKPDYETGVPTIDTQHKVLFDNINRLGKLLDQEDIDRAEADYLLDFLKQYVAQHFQFEESCMVRFRCPTHAKNKEQHVPLLNALTHFNEDCAALGPLRELLQRLHTTMVWWINSHILKVDIQLRGCVGSGKTAGLSPAPDAWFRQSHDFGKIGCGHRRRGIGRHDHRSVGELK